MPPLDQFRVREKLSKILETAGATETIFSPRQILSYLGQYIEKKSLHDSKNLKLVRCKGDELEDIFGVEEFVIGSCKEMWNFILPHIIPVLSKDSSSTEKDPATSQNSDNIVTRLEHSWMMQLPWWYFVQKPEEAKTATGSFVDNSTTFVKDTEYSSDSSSAYVLSHDERFSVEFEPDSASSSASMTDSDDTEPIESDEEMAYSAPSIPLTDSSDSTIAEDYWQCSECPNMNAPTVGYCQRCWKLRQNWWKSSIPDTALLKSFSLTQINETDDSPLFTRWSSDPQGVDVTDGKSTKRHRDTSQDDSGQSKKPALDREATLTVTSQSENAPSSSSQPDSLNANFTNSDIQPTASTASFLSSNELPSVSGIITQPPEPYSSSCAPSISSSNHIETTQSNCITSKQQLANVVSAVLEPSSMVKKAAKNGHESSPLNMPKHPEMPGICNICRSHPNDASFVHGQTGHQYCCYKCAFKIFKRDGRCPVCRKPIENVIKNYIYQM